MNYSSQDQNRALGHLKDYSRLYVSGLLRVEELDLLKEAC